MQSRVYNHKQSVEKKTTQNLCLYKSCLGVRTRNDQIQVSMRSFTSLPFEFLPRPSSFRRSFEYIIDFRSVMLSSGSLHSNRFLRAYNSCSDRANGCEALFIPLVSILRPKIEHQKQSYNTLYIICLQRTIFVDLH